MATPSEFHATISRWIIRAALTVPLWLGLGYYIGSESFNRWLWSEQGPLELSHVFIPLFAMGLGLATFAAKGRIAAIRQAGLAWLAAGLCGLSLLCGAIAGEEASWGQHFVGWSTPETWRELNDQQETNLHNIGSWADQKPRAIVELGVIVFGLIWPLVDRLTSLRVPSSWRLFLPSAMVLPVALFAECTRILENGPKWLGIPRWPAFPRPSELQELYFYLFFALCVFTWRQRLLIQLAADRTEKSRKTEDAVTIRLHQRAA